MSARSLHRRRPTAWLALLAILLVALAPTVSQVAMSLRHGGHDSHHGHAHAAAATQVEQLKAASTQVRALKAEYNLASKRDVKLSVVATDEQWSALSGGLAGFARMSGAAEVVRTTSVAGRGRRGARGWRLRRGDRGRPRDDTD